jgi:uncharacterized RDD family membrane protein YckC
MIRASRSLGVLALLAVLSVPLAAAPPQVDISFDTYDHPALRILQNYTLRADDTARQVLVIAGDAKIEGRVTRDVVVILGKTELASTAVIEGSFIVVAGTAEIAEGAKVNRDFVVIGGSQAPAGFSPGGEHIVIGTAGLGEGLRALVPWLTHGLLLGRPIVPSLGWVWIVAAIFFFINFCLNLLFDVPVRACAATLRESPFSAFIAGLLVMLLFGPVSVLLAVSVIGVAVIPFLMCAIVAAGILGRVGFARWLGMSLVTQEDPADRAASTRSFVLGSALMCGAYMIPFLGFVVWGLAGVFGLGSATLAFYAKYRRENPRPPKKVKNGTATAPVVVAPAMPPGASAAAPVQAEPAAYAEAAEVASLPADDAPPAEPFVSLATSPVEPVSLPKAVFLERLAALALDTIVIFILAQLLNLDRYYGGMNERLLLLLALAYHITFWTMKGTTLGGIICQLRVVRTDGRKLEFPESLVRGLTGIFSLAVVGLGFLWILRDPERQAWHDRVAGTYVVKVPRAYPI